MRTLGYVIVERGEKVLDAVAHHASLYSSPSSARRDAKRCCSRPYRIVRIVAETIPAPTKAEDRDTKEKERG